MRVGARAARQITLALSGAGACWPPALRPQPTLKPQARPAGLVKPAKPLPTGHPLGGKPVALTEYYAREQQKTFWRKGLMRTDGGGPDTRFYAETL